MEKKVDWKRVFIFCGFAFGLAYLIGLVIWLTGGLSESPELAPGLNLALALLVVYMLTPALANILTRIVTGEGWNNVLLRPRFKKGWLFWLLSWIGTPVLLGIGLLVYFLIFPQYYDPELGSLSDMLAASGVLPETVALPLQVILLAQVLQAIVIAPVLNALPILGEEFGWRAYLQPKLIVLGPRKGLLTTGAIWGLWHAPIIAMGYNYGNFDLYYFGAPWTGIIMMTLATMWLGVFFGWLSYKAQSVWPAVIGHGSLNGIAPVALLMAKGTPLMLLGPTAVGLVGGVGFILVSVVIFLVPGAFSLPQEVSIDALLESEITKEAE